PAAHDGDERIAKSKKDHASPHRQGRDAFNTSARAFLHNQDPQRTSARAGLMLKGFGTILLRRR
ncbi:MAG: hypothetical protein ABSE67_22260, partial [Xanthobacteraceae bacterium]